MKSSLIFTISLIAAVNCLAQEQLATKSTPPAVILVQSTKDQVPPEILRLDPRSTSIPNEAPYSVLIAVTDDSGILPGDDLGYTYGLKILGTKILKNGIHLAISYTTDLYAQDEGRLSTNNDGSFKALQKFTNENILKFVIDNSSQNRLLYYKAEIGWQRLQSKSSGGFLNASEQQLWFHKLIHNVRQPVDESDGIATRDGALGGGIIGVQTHKKLSDSTFFSAHAAGGVRLSTITDATYGLTEVESSLLYQPHYLGAKLTAHVDIKANDKGAEYDPSIQLAVLAGQSFEAGAEYKYYLGKPLNYELYNVKSIWSNSYDPTLEIYLKYGFGKKSE